MLRQRFLTKKAKKDEEERRRLELENEQVSKAEVLKERILARRKTKNEVSRLAEAGMRALVSNLKSKGHTFNSTEVILNDKPKIQDMNRRARIRDVLIEQDIISRQVTDCAKIQMQMELEMKRNEGIARPHIRADLPKAMGLYERVSRLRRLANEKKIETLKDSGENRVRNELSVVEKPVSLTKKCPHCREDFLEYMLPKHMISCTLLRGVSENKKSHSHSQRLTRYLDQDAPAVCPHCCHRIPRKRYEKHVQSCKTIQEHSRQRALREASAAGIDLESGKRRPGVPTNLLVEALGPSRIRMTWIEPIFDGGFPVQQYVIQYQKRHTHKVGKRVWYTYDPFVSIETSQFLLRNPVCHRGYVLHGLDASQTYANFSVKAWNRMGFSDPSNVVDVVTTMEPEAPSPPRHLTVVRVFSDSIRLRWALPHCTGGSPLSHAEIEFDSLQWIDLDRHRTALTLNTVYGSEGGQQWTTHRLDRVPFDALAYSIRRLEGSREYRNVRVRMINEAGLASAWSTAIKSVKTPAPSRVQVVVDEINRVHNLKFDFLDSNFFAKRYPQRYQRGEYITLLSNELKTNMMNMYRESNLDEDIVRDLETRGLPPNIVGPFSNTVPASIWLYCRQLHNSHVLIIMDQAPYPNGRYVCDRCLKRKRGRVCCCVICGLDYCESCVADFDASLLKPCQDRDKNNNQEVKENNNRQESKTHDQNKEQQQTEQDKKYEIRRKHFMFRIRTIENKIENATKENQTFAENITGLDSENRYAFESIKATQLELERVRESEADVVDTSIIHSEPQRYDRVRLIFVLQERLGLFQSKMVIRNNKILEKQNAILRNQKLIKSYEENLKDRRAALMAFERAQTRKKRADAVMKRAIKTAVPKTFGAWKRFVDIRKREREICFQCFARMLQIKTSSAFNTWKKLYTDTVTITHAASEVTGAGSQMLVKSHFQREDLRHDVQASLSALAKIKLDLSRVDMSESQVKYMTSSALWDKTDIARRVHADERDVDSAEARLAQADAYLTMGEHERALRVLEQYLKKCKIRGDTQGMGIAYGRMGKVLRDTGEPQKALLCHQRQASLAKECNDVEGMAMSSMHLGQIHVDLGQLRHGLREIEQSVVGWLKLRDRKREAMSYRLLAKVHGLLEEEVNGEATKRYTKMADEIEMSLRKRLRGGVEATHNLVSRMVGVQSEDAEIVTFQPCTAALPKLRRKYLLEERARDDFKEKSRESLRKVPQFQAHLAYCEDRLIRAQNSQYTEMDSDFLHKGLFQRFKVTELIETIEKEITKTQEELKENKREHDSFEIEIRNREDNMKEINRYIEIEEGALMQKVLDKRLCRIVALNRSNLEAYDVTGGSSGGVRKVVLALRKSIMVFNLLSGKCINMFGADEDGTHVGETKGHTHQISCLYFREEYIYSGSVDGDVRVWHVDEDSCVAQLEGHTGSVWSVTANHEFILSAASDLEIRIWSNHLDDGDRFECLKVVRRGHAKTVRAIEYLGLSEFVTGGADGRVLMWSIRDSKRSKVDRVRLKCKLIGHGCSVTALAVSKTSLMSGDVKGSIIQWDTKERRILRRFDGHRGAVSVIQFDMSKVVSGGRDSNILIHDIITGRCLVTLHGHTSSVSALQYDKNFILTGSLDGTIRRWPIRRSRSKGDNKIKDEIPPKVKYHIVVKGDTLAYIGKQYEIDVKHICFWNEMNDSQDLWEGQRVIISVSDVNGNLLTDKKVKNLHKPRGDRPDIEVQGV